jgi:hypothetical protein
MSTIFPLMLYAYRHNALVAENYASFIILLLIDILGDFKKEFLDLVHWIYTLLTTTNAVISSLLFDHISLVNFLL